MDVHYQQWLFCHVTKKKIVCVCEHMGVFACCLGVCVSMCLVSACIYRNTWVHFRDPIQLV